MTLREFQIARRMLIGSIVLLALAFSIHVLPLPVVHATSRTTLKQSVSVALPASIRTVTTTNDSGVGSLRQAIADAISGDTIVFSLTLPNVITLTTGVLGVNKSITLTGPGPNNLAISGNNSSGVFQFIGTLTATFSSLKIANGFNNGGVFVGSSTSTVLISNTIIYNNRSTNSAGISNSGGKVTVRNSTILSNTATNATGGIGNTGIMTIVQSTIAQNSSSNGGGGIANFGGAIMVVSQSTISDNTTASNGGGGVSNTGSLTLTNSTLSGNSIVCCTGAGIDNPLLSGTLNLNNVTITKNSGASAISSGLGTSNIKNSIIAGNSSDCFGTLISQGNNILGDNSNCAGLIDGSNGDKVGTSGSPIDPKLTPLAWLGGPTQVHGLLGGSPAINAGNNATCLTTDQRGVTRPLTVGNACDIGAFEGTAFALYLPLIMR